jgi:hypothetical protein
VITPPAELTAEASAAVAVAAIGSSVRMVIE